MIQRKSEKKMDIMENNGQLQLEENTGTEELEQSLPGFDKTQYGKKIPVEIGEDDQAGGEGANETDNTPLEDLLLQLQQETGCFQFSGVFRCGMSILPDIPYRPPLV